jgi:hypothetical protein
MGIQYGSSSDSLRRLGWVDDEYDDDWDYEDDLEVYPEDDENLDEDEVVKKPSLPKITVNTCKFPNTSNFYNNIILANNECSICFDELTSDNTAKFGCKHK